MLSFNLEKKCYKLLSILKLVELSLLLNYYIWKMLTWWGRGRERGRIHVKQRNVTTAITPLLLYSHHHPGRTTGMPTSLSPLYCHKETLTDLSQSPMGDAALCQYIVHALTTGPKYQIHSDSVFALPFTFLICYTDWQKHSHVHVPVKKFVILLSFLLPITGVNFEEDEDVHEDKMVPTYKRMFGFIKWTELTR